MGNEEALTKIQQLTTVEKIARLSDANFASVLDNIEKSEPDDQKIEKIPQAKTLPDGECRSEEKTVG